VLRKVLVIRSGKDGADSDRREISEGRYKSYSPDTRSTQDGRCSTHSWKLPGLWSWRGCCGSRRGVGTGIEFSESFALVAILAVRAKNSERRCFNACDPILNRPTALRLTGCRVARHQGIGGEWIGTGESGRRRPCFGAALYAVYEEQVLSGRTIASCAGTGF